MITGAHSIISSTNPDADRAFLRDVLSLPHVNAGDGWLIFGLPAPARAPASHGKKAGQAAAPETTRAAESAWPRGAARAAGRKAPKKARTR